ncbi:MAG: hypothetical protein ACE5OS_14435 [Anaerolineae bacterium]
MYRSVKPNKLPFLALGLLIVASLACQAVTEPTPTPPVTPSTEASSPVPTETPTVQPTAVPTEVPTEVPTATSAPLPTATEQPAAPELAIVSFTVDVEDIATGKRLTFDWQTTGATRVVIWSGTKQRFPDAWAGPPNGTLTQEVTFTYYRNPLMTLVAYDDEGNQASQSVTVEWPCTHDYFFPADFSVCPSSEASPTWAAEQPFEHGRMLWLEKADADNPVLEGVIFVFYADGRCERHDDTWTEGMPESDPAFVPPAGLLQPIRGFGKLWRENADVRDRLGWATAPEQGFDTTWQAQIQESIGGVAFVRALDGRIIQINGWDAGVGTWQHVTP